MDLSPSDAPVKFQLSCAALARRPLHSLHVPSLFQHHEMSTSVWPPIAPDLLKKEQDAALVCKACLSPFLLADELVTKARELAWLLDSLQETLESLKSGLDDCYALLSPIEPGNTLVMSTPRSESIKGHVTRVGSRIAKGVRPDYISNRLSQIEPLGLII